MTIVYNLGIHLYSFLIKISSLFNKKAKLIHVGRKESLQRIAEIKYENKPIWIHCSSLGEFEQGRPIIEAIKKKNPVQRIILTFFSPSGYEVRKDYELADEVLYLPADTKRNARKFISSVKPKIVIFIKYEFWFHFLNELYNDNVPTYIVSAIFRKEHAFFKWYGGWYRKMLGFFTKLYIQDEESGELLENIGVNNFVVCGDTRFDRVYEIAQMSKEFPALDAFAQNSKVLVGGSTWPEGEKLIANYLKKNKDLKVLLAPHEIHEEHIKDIEKLMPVSCARYTKLEGIDLKTCQVLIVDTMGMLSSMYRYGDFAYIGGGFGSGIHNTIEASTFGLPVIFGPNYRKYQEACDLIEVEAAFSVVNQEQFDLAVDKFFHDEKLLKRASVAAVEYVNKMRGATELVVNELFS